MMPSCSKISGVAMIVPDVNVLVHAMDSGSAQHDKAWAWWYSALHGDEHIGFAWPVLMGYVRITTHPRIMVDPQSVADALRDVRAWTGSPIARMIGPGPEHVHVIERLVASAGAWGNLIPDAHLAAIAVENGGTIYSQDADFARFDGVRWINPLT